MAVSEETLRRLKRLGGVDLSDPRTHIGLTELPVGYWFECPMCGNRAKNNQAMSPMCTGPSWTNDHPPEVMFRIKES